MREVKEYCKMVVEIVMNKGKSPRWWHYNPNPNQHRVDFYWVTKDKVWFELASDNTYSVMFPHGWNDGKEVLKFSIIDVESESFAVDINMMSKWYGDFLETIWVDVIANKRAKLMWVKNNA